MMVLQHGLGSSVQRLMRFPRTSPLGQKRRTMVSLIIALGTFQSSSVNNLPSRSGIPKAEKYPRLTVRNCTIGLAPALGTGCPSITNLEACLNSLPSEIGRAHV